MAGEELVAKYQTLIFLAGSASAEFFADMALSPFEAVKVRVGFLYVLVWMSGVCTVLSCCCARFGVAVRYRLVTGRQDYSQCCQQRAPSSGCYFSLLP
jgi:hypothetical protein